MKDKQIHLQALKVLSLEDSLPDFELIRYQLLQAGYNLDIYRTDTEPEFVSLLNQDDFDIILADYHLPSFDALSALNVRNQICPGTPFICVSGYIGEEKAIELMKQGANDYVLKDRPQRLPFAINRALKEVKEKEIKRNFETQLRKLSSAVDQSPASVVITDTFGNIEYVNKKFCQITGYSQEESMGKNPRILKSGHHDKNFYENMWKAILSGKEWEGEMINKKKNGELYWEHASIAPILADNGAIAHFVAVKEDISERIKSDQIQQVIYSISNTALSSVGLDELIRIVGVELGNLLDTTNFYIAFYQEDSGMFSTSFGKDEKDQIDSWPAERSASGLIIKYQQSLLAYDTDIARLVDAGEIDMIGTPSKVWLGVPLLENKRIFGVLVVQNYENRNAYKEKDKVMLEFIAQEISLAILRKKAERDLIAALWKAEESDRLKSAFLNNLSHEIRTPMNGILGFSDLLKEPGLSGDQQQEYIRIIEMSGARMLNIINDIVDISKIEAGIYTLNISETNVNRKIENIYQFFKREIGIKGVQLSFKNGLSYEDATIFTDSEKLDAILSNLVKNAVKYTDSGSIEFGYSLVETLHATSLPATSPHLHFFVKDTGIGIAGPRQEAVFERFIQADISDTKAYQGAGLGLSISKAFVEMLGGTIWLESEENKGTTVFFTIPYNPPLREKAVNPANFSEMTDIGIDKSAELKILIVEDDLYSELYLYNSLKKFSSKIRSVKTGSKAVETCREEDIDLVLMDIKLPDINGYEATRQIRQFNQKVVIIAQTAHVLLWDREKAILAGCNDYISKPISQKELIALIHKYAK
jgi:PAS domain S-box-containing protein